MIWRPCARSIAGRPSRWGSVVSTGLVLGHLQRHRQPELYDKSKRVSTGKMSDVEVKQIIGHLFSIKEMSREHVQHFRSVATRDGASKPAGD